MAPIPFPTWVSFTKTWHNDTYPFISPTRPELSAAGKNVIISGGGTGIGKATAIAFAEAGAKSVAILGRRIDRLETAAKEIRAANADTRVLIQTADTTIRDSIESGLLSLVAKTGKIDIYCANAGVLGTEGPVLGFEEPELRRVLENNIIGTFNQLQAFAPLAAEDATLLYVGSAIGNWLPLEQVPGVFAYGAAKAATLKMVDYFAFQNSHIHVVSLQPGIVGTEINPRIPVGFDTVELPAHTLVWFASEEAKFLNGKFVYANWGAEELVQRADEIRNSMLLKVSLNGVGM